MNRENKLARQAVRLHRAGKTELANLAWGIAKEALNARVKAATNTQANHR